MTSQRQVQDARVSPGPLLGRVVRLAAVTAVMLIGVAAGTHPAPAAAAPPATAATAGALVVTGAAGSVRIEQDPYRLQVLDPAGAVRLSEVANPVAAPTPYASTDAVPLGSNDGQTAPLLAPLVLTVGSAAHPTYPATPFSGNLLVGAATGVQYAATSVLSSASDGAGGLAVEVGSTEPTGTTFHLDVRPDGPRFRIDVTLRGGAVPVADALIGDSFDAPAGAAFHGFGGRHESTDLRGSEFDSWLEEENFSAGPASAQAGAASGAGAGYLFPNGPSAAYYVQPEFISQGYGFLDNQTDLLRWRMAPSDTPTAWQLTAASTSMHYVIAPSDPQSSIWALSAVTGRQPVPPAWALLPQIDRGVYVADTAAGYQAKVVSDLDHFAAHDVPDSAYRIEGWALLAPADLAADIARLKALGIHPLLYYRSFASIDHAGTEDPSVFTTALANGYFATTTGGAPYLVGGSFGAPAGVIDFTNPAARTWFAQRLDAGLDLGADGFMVDFGEQVAPDMHFADGQTGATMHNAYPIYYQQLVSETVTTYEKAHPGRQIFYYDRAGYSGSAGYEAANFPGDETTDFSPASGLQSLTPDMLNRGIGGAFGYTTDIGGYEDAITGATTSELLLRWAEWAALSPVFRLHGSAGQGTHVPWNYDAVTLTAYKSLAELRERLAPMIGQLWAQAAATGTPLITPLWLAYPTDPVAAKQDQEWLLGPDILAAPVVVQGETTETAYLPAGCWTYMPTHVNYPGQQSVTVAAPVQTLSWFTRCGTTPVASLTVKTAVAAHPAATQRTPTHRPSTHLPSSQRRNAPPAGGHGHAGGSLAATGGLPAAGTALVTLLAGAGVAATRRARPSRRRTAPTDGDYRGHG